MKTCIIDGCEKKHYGRSWCQMHYKRWQTHGDPMFTVGSHHGMHGTPEYITWDAMKSRTTNPNHKQYTDYGGRGITVCDSWRDSFLAFLKDMGTKPKGKSREWSLERLNNNKGYSKENCVWSRQSAQVHNQRPRSNTGVKGVHRLKNGQYKTQICKDDKRINLGTFNTLEEAHVVYKQTERQLY